jgi:hypothetical protein
MTSARPPCSLDSAGQNRQSVRRPTASTMLIGQALRPFVRRCYWSGMVGPFSFRGSLQREVSTQRGETRQLGIHELEHFAQDSVGRPYEMMMCSTTHSSTMLSMTLCHVGPHSGKRIFGSREITRLAPVAAPNRRRRATRAMSRLARSLLAALWFLPYVG